jgi:hypothetical protein
MQHNIGVLIFSEYFGRSISRFKENSVRYYHKFAYSFMKSTTYSCHTLLKSGIFSIDFQKVQKMQKYNICSKSVQWYRLSTAFVKNQNIHHLNNILFEFRRT